MTQFDITQAEFIYNNHAGSLETLRLYFFGQFNNSVSMGLSSTVQDRHQRTSYAYSIENHGDLYPEHRKMLALAISRHTEGILSQLIYVVHKSCQVLAQTDAKEREAQSRIEEAQAAQMRHDNERQRLLLEQQQAQAALAKHQVKVEEARLAAVEEARKKAKAEAKLREEQRVIIEEQRYIEEAKAQQMTQEKERQRVEAQDEQVRANHTAEQRRIEEAKAARSREENERQRLEAEREQARIEQLQLEQAARQQRIEQARAEEAAAQARKLAAEAEALRLEKESRAAQAQALLLAEQRKYEETKQATLRAQQQQRAEEFPVMIHVDAFLKQTEELQGWIATTEQDNKVFELYERLKAVLAGRMPMEKREESSAVVKRLNKIATLNETYARNIAAIERDTTLPEEVKELMIDYWKRLWESDISQLEGV